MSGTNAEYVVKDLKECRTRIYSASEYEARLHANRQEKKVVEDVVGTEQSETRGSVEKQRDEDIRSWNTLRRTRGTCHHENISGSVCEKSKKKKEHKGR